MMLLNIKELLSNVYTWVVALGVDLGVILFLGLKLLGKKVNNEKVLQELKEELAERDIQISNKLESKIDKHLTNIENQSQELYEKVCAKLKLDKDESVAKEAAQEKQFNDVINKIDVLIDLDKEE